MARKILLADDSVTAQNMGRKILADAGYEVTTVNNGSAALKKIAEQRPDLIVLDVYMPGYSGLEVCQRLKEAGDTSRIPILLTVGKLEPFKPEEAKRVRADGFIVKPFEASELLSALSKLEDKIVPRAETSKPGRLARATAALDDVPRDKAVSGEDSSWKNRIAFPSKKKSEEAAADDSAIYNPVNKDLRTVIEPRPAAEAKSEPKPEESRVDLGALAPEGLPKDVTPEEIAALASAAAQIQGKVLESKAEEAAEAKVGEANIETKHETKLETAAPVAEPVSAAASAMEETKAAQDTVKESAPVSAPAEAIAEAKPKSEEGNSEKASRDAEHDDVPVTMAVAAGTDSARSHWTAVAVALAPEESGISLEEEMRKAAAVYATPASDSGAAEVSAPAAEPVEAVAPAPAPDAPGPVVAEAIPAVVEAPAAATEAVRATVKEFETVAAAYVPEAEAAQSYAAPVASSPSAAEASTSAEVQPADPSPAFVPPVVQETATIEAQPQPPAAENLKSEEPESKLPEAPAAEPEMASPVAQAAEPEAPAESSPQREGALPRRGEKAEPENDHIAATTAAAWASWRRIRESDAPSGPSDSAAMAAAAGAEKTPEEAASGFGSDPAIASIVDSVLADLRPRIVEEISRKLGKKS
ncbi:MAG TPA: response regulator [Candidatus Sulfotelmatobacter sp.]